MTGRRVLESGRAFWRPPWRRGHDVTGAQVRALPVGPVQPAPRPAWLWILTDRGRHGHRRRHSARTCRSGLGSVHRCCITTSTFHSQTTTVGQSIDYRLASFESFLPAFLFDCLKHYLRPGLYGGTWRSLSSQLLGQCSKLNKVSSFFMTQFKCLGLQLNHCAICAAHCVRLRTTTHCVCVCERGRRNQRARLQRRQRNCPQVGPIWLY